MEAAGIPLKAPLVTTEEENSSAVPLRRNMNYRHAFAFVVGCIIGAGIFVTPSLIARRTPNLFVSLLAWLLAGGLALLGALCYCEMVSVVKKTGGSYIFILDCYGEAAGFCVNWTNTMIFAPCDACILLITIGSYACAPFFEDHTSVEYEWTSKCVGVFVMFIIAFISSLGARKSGVFQMAFMLIQMMVFLTIVCLGIYSASTSRTIVNLTPQIAFNNTISGLKNDLPSFSIAMFNALYCFDGYVTVAFIVEEVINPAQTIPLVAFTSIPFVTLVYIIVNLASAAALSHYEMSMSDLFIYDIAKKVGGETFAYIVPFSVAICIIPGLAAVFYNLPRLIMSSAREGQFPSFFSLIHKNRRTPVPAIIYLVVLATILTFAGFTVQTMLQICNIAIWFEYAFAVSTILVNRWKRPNVERNYRTWITTPVFMIIIPMVLLCLVIIEKPVSTCVILFIMALGLPIYYVCLYKKWFSFLPFSKIQLWLMKRFPLVVCEPNHND